MQNIATTALDEGLVPLGRLGSALHARRSAGQMSVSGLSRSSDARFLPDELIVLERGDVVIDDSRVAALVGLYDLEPVPLPLGEAVRLVVDRTTSRDVAGGASAIFSAIDVDAQQVDIDLVLSRFIALSVLLCLDMTCGAIGLDVLAEALGLDVPQMTTRFARLIDEHGDELVALTGRLAQRLVVPRVGLLLADLPNGSVVAVRRNGDESRTRKVDACGRLADLIDQSC